MLLLLLLLLLTPLLLLLLLLPLLILLLQLLPLLRLLLPPLLLTTATTTTTTTTTAAAAAAAAATTTTTTTTTTTPLALQKRYVTINNPNVYNAHQLTQDGPYNDTVTEPPAGGNVKGLKRRTVLIFSSSLALQFTQQNTGLLVGYSLSCLWLCGYKHTAIWAPAKNNCHLTDSLGESSLWRN